MAVFMKFGRLDHVKPVHKCFTRAPGRNAWWDGNKSFHSLHRHGVLLLNCSKHQPALCLDYQKDRCSQIRHYSERRKQTALALITDLKHLKSSPKPALILGVSGLIPFIAAPAYMAVTTSFVASIAYSQVAYGACILSFIGAVRWGMAIADNEIVKPNWVNLGYSVTPALVAWFALLMPTALALSTLILGLGGAAFMDLTMWGYPPWFKAMRFLLTVSAMLALWTTLVFRYILTDSSSKKMDGKKAKEVASDTEKEHKENLVNTVKEAIKGEVKSTDKRKMGSEKTDSEIKMISSYTEE